MRVVIADDSALLRAGVAQLLASGGIDVVAEVGDADALVRAVETEQPDLAIIDVRMPPTHTDEGMRAALQLRAESSTPAVLVLSQYVETRHAARLLDTARQGLGYVLKDRIIDADHFLEIVHRVATGASVIDPEVVRQLFAQARADDPLASLSDREREVLALVAEGRSNAAIADALFVTEKTIEVHIRSIFNKLALPATSLTNRRVLAVVTYLRAAKAPAAGIVE